MLKKAIVLSTVLGLVQVTYADRVLVTLSGQVSAAYNAHVRVSAFPGVNDQFTLSANLSGGDSALIVRDAIVPESGASVGTTNTLRRITCNGEPGFVVGSAGDAVVGIFGTTNNWLEPGTTTDIGGILYTADIVDDLHCNLTGGAATIPAVGGVGLGILIATIVAAGGWVLSKRKGFARTA